MLFKFGKVTSPRFSFCKLHSEIIMHLFYDCLTVKKLWNQIILFFRHVPPQNAIFGFWDLDMNEHLILNQLLLFFKMYIYSAKTAGYLNISHLLIYIKGIKDTENTLCGNNAKRRKKLTRNEKMF